ncbi:hypothetical protein BSKO_09030 [Bryopsis sp. KO-2023]|nr:hypothetical protein BSKO_09030 [Bryopsis sp. KO-2023]
METGSDFQYDEAHLFTSASKGEFDAVKIALEAGLDVNVRNGAGKSLAHVAAAGGHTKILRLLIAARCNLKAKDHSGNSVAHDATRRSQLDVLKLLKKEGVVFSAVTKKGESVEDVAKAPHIKSYVAYASKKKDDSNWNRQPAPGPNSNTKQDARQKKKPLGAKNKKEYLKWKRERDRTRRQNELDSDEEIKVEDLSGVQGIGSAAPERFSQVQSKGKAKSKTRQELETPFQYVSDLVRLEKVTYFTSGQILDGRKDGQDESPYESSSVTSSSGEESGEEEEEVPLPPQDDEFYMPRCRLEDVGWSEEGLGLTFPKRPHWQGMATTTDELHALEKDSFAQWQDDMNSRFDSQRLSSYERNLEYWRQLWRVTERADICMVIVDARNPLLHFSHALYTHVTEAMGLKVIIVLNKCDLVPTSAIEAWSQYFEKLYPGVSTVPVHASKGGEQFTRRALLGSILNVEIGGIEPSKVQEVVGMDVEKILEFRERANTFFEGKCEVRKEGKFDEDWDSKGKRAKRKEARREKRRARAAMESSNPDNDEGNSRGGGADGKPIDQDNENAQFDSLAPRSGSTRHDDQQRPVVVCVIGEPNVGKSTTMNALLGMKKMAVSAHPGRTKHYQTYYLTPKLMLCDCPGLVFPRLDVVMPLQVLFGSFPIARCRDPYCVVRYLGERIWPRLHNILNISKDSATSKSLSRSSEAGPSPLDNDIEWTAYELCETFASKKNWYTTRGGRLDVYRAANFILRGALAGSGSIRLAFWPPESLPWKQEESTSPNELAESV